VWIVTEKRIREFIEREPLSIEPIASWIETIRNAVWASPAELKATFAHASFIGDLTVFNLGGNKYRLVAFVHYRAQIVYIKRIGTHKEYDTWKL
jgi:mRNA interferase HigB